MASKDRDRINYLIFAGLAVLVIVNLFPQIIFFGIGDNSQGTRIGTVVKFSQRGWIWQTLEGELAMGSLKGGQTAITTYILEFSLCDKDPQKIARINSLIGQEVLLKYNSPTIWFRWNQGSKYCVEEITLN